jgi:hypothetical protein
LRSIWASSSPRSAPFCGEAALAAVCRLMPLPSLTIETGGGVEVPTNPAKGAPTTADSRCRARCARNAGKGMTGVRGLGGSRRSGSDPLLGDPARRCCKTPHQGPPGELCADAQALRNAGRSHESSARHHSQAHANSSALSKHAPWAGDKGLGRNGIPKPAGAGGGSSSLSLAPGVGPTRLSSLEITPRRRLESGNRSQSSRRAGATSSSKTSARRIASTSTTAPLSRRRKEGEFSTARASEIHDARRALFSAKGRSGSHATSSGWM